MISALVVVYIISVLFLYWLLSRSPTTSSKAAPRSSIAELREENRLDHKTKVLPLLRKSYYRSSYRKSK